MGKLKIKLNMKFFALVAVAAARHHHHHHHDAQLLETQEAYEAMSEDQLLVSLQSKLDTALASEARGDADAAVAKTAAIKNIQKALTARILKRLDEGHRGHAAPDQRHGAPPQYHAVGRARPRERHQDPPEGRRCPRHGQEVSSPHPRVRHREVVPKCTLTCFYVR